MGIAVALIGGPAYAAADDYAALFACGIIAINGFLILRRSFDEVVDARVPAGMEESIRNLSSTVAGVTGIEKCRIRKAESATSSSFTFMSTATCPCESATASDIRSRNTSWRNVPTSSMSSFISNRTKRMRSTEEGFHRLLITDFLRNFITAFPRVFR